jgi:hypothetical protein
LIGLSVTVRTRSITLFAIAGVACASNTRQPSSPTITAEFGSPSAVKA